MKKLILLMTLPLILTACGKRGPLVPPDTGVPPGVADLAVRQQGDQLFVSWPLPKGDRKEWRVTYILLKGKPACPSCAEGMMPVREIDPQFPKGAREEAGRLVVTEKTPAPGEEVSYSVTSHGPGGDAYGKIVRFRAAAPGVAPTLTATTRGGFIDLSWTIASDAKVTGIRIYRRTDKTPEQAIATLPGGSTSYTDPTPTPGTRHTYRVTLTLAAAGGTVETPFSNEATAEVEVP